MPSIAEFELCPGCKGHGDLIALDKMKIVDCNVCRGTGRVSRFKTIVAEAINFQKRQREENRKHWKRK